MKVGGFGLYSTQININNSVKIGDQKQILKRGINKCGDYSKKQMKELMTIFGTILFTAVILTSCGVSNQKLKEQAAKDSIEAVNNTARILKAKADSLAQKNSVDSLNKISAINEILGKYNSKEKYVVTMDGEIYSSGSAIVLAITKKNDKIIFAQSIVHGHDMDDLGYGGGDTDARAEMLEIKKTETGIYQMIMKKLRCECRYDILSGTTSESNFKSDDEFFLTINMKNKTNTTIESNAVKTKCPEAWDFKGFTFVKK